MSDVNHVAGNVVHNSPFRVMAQASTAMLAFHFNKCSAYLY